MYFLIFDTSSVKGIFSIVHDDQVLFHQKLAFGVRESNELIPSVEMGLAHAGLNISEIDTLIISRGPGSFTGLRIGASVAKGLSFARSIPIMTVESLKCFNPELEGAFSVILDAKSKGLCVQHGRQENGEIFYEENFHIMTPKDLSSPFFTERNLLTADKESLKAKIAPDIFERIQEAYPNPLQMVQLTKKKPKTALFRARDTLDLEYFSQPHLFSN